jgi:tRNA U38,U39,U40 pseudouridine synthase TruA
MSIDMKDNKRINVSSLIDNEQGSDEQFTDVLNELSSSETAAASWKNYHLIGDVLRDEVPQSLQLDLSKTISKLNGVLPKDIAIHNIYKVNENANCRFDAISRIYHYHIIHQKLPKRIQSLQDNLVSCEALVSYGMVPHQNQAH